MNVRNCRKCGKVYAYDGVNRLCPACRKEEEEEFKRVKEYIYDNPGATIQMVSEATGVDAKKILKYLREGKLEIKSENSNLLLDCEKCGRPIKSGRFCDECKSQLEREFKSAISKEKDSRELRKRSDKDKLYIADRHKR